MRDRITITIKGEVLDEVDKMINNLTIRSRSQAIEYLLSKNFEQYKVSNVLILAGGKDTIEGKLKCMVDVNGKPVLERIISMLKSFGVENFVIYVNYKKEEITEYFGDGKKFGINIKYVAGDKPRGRALPLKLAKAYFNKTFLVYYGDTLCKIDINDMMRVHRDNRALATIALTTVSNPKRYGVVKLRGNRIIDFVEKPKESGSHLVSCGVFLIEPELLKYISKNMYSLETDLFPKLSKKNLLLGYPYEGLWLNINDKHTLSQARNLWI